MDHSTLSHHHQEMMSSDQSLDSMLASHTKPTNEVQQQVQPNQQQDQKKPKPPDEVQKCPRCDSTNTKFCYYNNYSLSQPRYFCKACRRYWTKGGTLRNVPVGGGCRKNRRSSSSSSSSSASRRCVTPDHHLMIVNQTASSSACASPSPVGLFSAGYESLHHQGLFGHFHKHGGGGGGGGFDHHAGNVSLLGNSHFDLFGNSFIDPSQHLYYGGIGSNNVNVNLTTTTTNTTHDDHDHHHHQMGPMQFEHQSYQHSSHEIMSNPSSGSSTPTTIKQELGDNKVLWGLPWQIGNGGEVNNFMNVASVVAGNNEFGDSMKESWNSHVGVLNNPTNWHSLLNSPLM